MSMQGTTSTGPKVVECPRKRICKACDRCRLKKSKCDGSYPCSRCTTDNSICVFGERKKSHDKAYPKGYAELLEQQQTQLVSGLQEMYKRLLAADAWSGSKLAQKEGSPLTHDILAALNVLGSGSGGNCEAFEENFQKLQTKLIEDGAPLIQSWSSSSSESLNSHQDHKPSTSCETWSSSSSKSLNGQQDHKQSTSYEMSTLADVSNDSFDLSTLPWPPINQGSITRNHSYQSSEASLFEQISASSGPQLHQANQFALDSPELNQNLDDMNSFGSGALCSHFDLGFPQLSSDFDNLPHLHSGGLHMEAASTGGTNVDYNRDFNLFMQMLA